MSVILKGMKMPSNCYECRARCSLAYISVSGDKKRHDDCQLVEIPSQHGRIIDERELFKQAPGKTTHHHERGFDWEIRNVNQWLKDNVPTILEAEGDYVATQGEMIMSKGTLDKWIGRIKGEQQMDTETAIKELSDALDGETKWGDWEHHREEVERRCEAFIYAIKSIELRQMIGSEVPITYKGKTIGYATSDAAKTLGLIQVESKEEAGQ